MAIRDEIRALIERGNVTYEEIYNLKVTPEELTATLPALSTIAFLCILQVQHETVGLRESVDSWGELRRRYRDAIGIRGVEGVILLRSANRISELEKELIEYERVSRNRIAALEQALVPLIRIADAYDENNLDDEARKHWGKDLEHTNTAPPEDIELYSGRGGKQLLTLADCFKARDAYKAAK